MKELSTYGIKEGYNPNIKNLYYDDTPEDNVIWQPDVYAYAIRYAKQHNIKNIIDIGSGNGEKLKKYKSDFNITFIDFGPNLDLIKEEFETANSSHTYIDQDFEERFPELKKEVVRDSVIICSDVIEHIRYLDNLVKALIDLGSRAKLLIVSTPERERLYGFDQSGMPDNKCHVREWTISEFNNLFITYGSNKHLVGLTRTNDWSHQRATLCLIMGADIFPEDLSRLSFSTDRGYLSKLLDFHELKSEENATYFKDKKLKHVVHLWNPYQDDFVANHFKCAMSQGYSLNFNRLKYANSNVQEGVRKGSIESIDRATVQVIDTVVVAGPKKEVYPIAFNVLLDTGFEADFATEYLSIPLAFFTKQYLLEQTLGFTKTNEVLERLCFTKDQSQLEKKISSLELLVENLRVQLDESVQKYIALDGDYERILKNPVLYSKKIAKKIIKS